MQFERKNFPRGTPSRRAFTLIELMVVCGIIVVLASILVPAINIMYRKSQVIAMKSNFHAIIGALENYKTDFGNYPRCDFGQTDPLWPNSYTTYQTLTSLQVDAYRPALPRTDATLAMALLGPGPYSAMTVQANNLQSSYPYADADGADGAGFRTQMAVVGTVPACSATVGATTISGNFSSFTLNSNNPLLPPFTVIALGGTGSADAHLQVISITSSTVTVANPIVGTPPGTAYASATATLLAPAGKTWGPYLPAERFKVKYATVAISSFPAATAIAAWTPPVYEQNLNPAPGVVVTAKFPQLLDVWGNPILYVPAYNSYANHGVAGTNPNKWTGNPALTIPTNAVSVGPLFGTPSSVLGSSGMPVYVNNSPLPPPSGSASQITGPSVFWSGSLSSLTTGQMAALLFRLGDQDASNFIDSTETFNVQTPFFLMSAGPTGYYTDFYPGQQTPPAGGALQWQNMNRSSSNVYSFDQ